VGPRDPGASAGTSGACGGRSLLKWVIWSSEAVAVNAILRHQQAASTNLINYNESDLASQFLMLASSGPGRSLNFQSGYQIVTSMTTSKVWMKMQRWAVMLPFALVASLAAGQQSQGELGGQTAPRVIFRPDPDYTSEAAQRGIEGKVYLKLEVLPDGRTNNVRVAKSLDPGLDQSAVETVAHWRFQPATKGGTPVLTEINVVVEFRGPTLSSPRPGTYTGLPCVAKVDSHEINKLLKKASTGDPKAQLAVGCAYEYGAAGLARDRAQAINWYGKAAETGLVPAQYFLGETYLRNFDFVHAYMWLRIADSGGYKGPNDTLRMVTTLLSADQLNEAEAQVVEWKRQHVIK
jgi:TonB family protein